MRPTKRTIAGILLVLALAAWSAFLQWQLGKHDQRIASIASKVMSMDEQIATDHDALAHQQDTSHGSH